MLDQAKKKLLDEMIKHFANPKVDELLINGATYTCLVSQNQHAQLEAIFSSNTHLLEWLQHFSYSCGVRLDPLTPASGGDYFDPASQIRFRWHCILTPIAKEGPLFSLRRHRFDQLTLEQFQYLPGVYNQLIKFFQTKHSIVFFGATGSGKTSLLSCLINAFCQNERILILESLAELPSQHPQWIRLCEQKPNLENQGAFSIQQLFEESMRLRPDRLIIGEIRNKEAKCFFDALSSGHSGTLTTMHAENAQQALARLGHLVDPIRSLTSNNADTLNLCFVGMARAFPPQVSSINLLEDLI